MFSFLLFLWLMGLNTIPVVLQQQFHETKKVFQFMEAMNVKRVCIFYDDHKEILSLGVNKWPMTIKLIALPTDSIQNTSTVLLFHQFEVIVVWLSILTRRNAFFDNRGFHFPFTLENRVLLFVLKNHIPSTLLNVDMQEQILWRGNQLFFTTQTLSIKLVRFRYKPEFNTFTKSILKLNCDEPKCVFQETSSMAINILEKQNLSVGVSPFQPDAILIEKFPNGTCTFQGFVYDLLSIYLCPMTNLNFVAVYGDKLNPPGDNVAMHNMILQKKLDTSTSPFILTPNGISSFDWVTLAMKFDYLALAISNSLEIKEFMWATFIEPFTLSCWTTIVLLRVAISCAAACSHFVDSAIPESGSLKTLKCTNLLFFFCMSSAYGAVLYASLTSLPNRNPYQSLEDLMKNENFDFHVHQSFHVFSIVKSAKSGQLLNLWQRMKNAPNQGKVANFDIAYSRVLSGYNVFLHYSDLLKHDLKLDCRYHLIKTHYQIGLHIGFKKYARYSEIFTQKLLMVKQYGLLAKLQKAYVPERLCSNTHFVFKSCTIYHIISVFVLLVFGNTLATITLLIECIVHKYY